MTQQQLGEAVGIEVKGTANHIAQYECDYRIPQNDMLIDMAKAMDINLLLFVSPLLGSAEDIMHTFFWLDEDNRNAINFFTLIRTNKRDKADMPPGASYDDCGKHQPKKGWKNNE